MYGPYAIDPQLIPEALQGIDVALLEELYDVAFAYGSAAPQGRVHRLSHAVPKPMYVSVTVPPSLARRIYVSDIPGGLRTNGASVLPLDADKMSFVAVCAGITVEDIRAFVVAVDAVFQGAKDASGKRVRVLVPDANVKMRVDDVFAAGKPVSLDETPEQLSERIDRPQDVVLLGRLEDGQYLYCHRREYARAMAQRKKKDGTEN